MTIDELNALATLTAGDEFPVWDSEESGESTKKITAQNMTASVKTLGNLVNTSEMNSALAGKQNTLTFDSTPTAGSTNPVTSGGVADAIQQSTAVTVLQAPDQATLATNIQNLIFTMPVSSGKKIQFSYSGVTDNVFKQYAVYSGEIYRITAYYFTGSVTNNVGDTVVISRNGENSNVLFDNNTTALSNLMTTNMATRGSDNPATYTPGLYSLVGSDYVASYWPDQNLYGILIVWSSLYYLEALILCNNNALYVGHADKSATTPTFRWRSTTLT